MEKNKRNNGREKRKSVSERNGAKEEVECSDDYPDRINMSKVSDTKRKFMFFHLLEFSVSARRQPGRKKNRRETKMCVGDFFAFGEDSFFLPVAFAAGSTRPLRDINYIFQRWMQFRNKNPLSMSDGCELLIPFSKEKKKEKKDIAQFLSNAILLFDKFSYLLLALFYAYHRETYSPCFTLPILKKNKFNVGVLHNCPVLIAGLESQTTIKIINIVCI